MMTLACVVSYRFLKRQVFFTTEQKKITHRRLDIRPMKNRTFRDSQTALESDRIGGRPAGRQHSRQQIVFVADDRKVEWIAMKAPAGGCDSGAHGCWVGGGGGKFSNPRRHKGGR